MTTDLTTWDEVRRLADELEVQVHLGTMDARDRWRALQPRLHALEEKVAHPEHVTQAVQHELAEVRAALQHLRDEVYFRARGDFAHGW